MGTLYENIKSLCDANNTKPGRMCAEIGISKGLISDLKAGRKKTIQIETAKKIADFFSIPVESLMNETDATLYSTAKDAVLIRAFDALPTAEKEARLRLDLATKKEAPTPSGGNRSDLINDGTELAADNTSSRKKTAPLYSNEAAKIAKDYDSLDHWGKTAVRSVADTELARMQDEARFLVETSMEPEPKVVNLFTDPSAAGPALGITGQSCEPYTLTPDDPQGAAYAVRVQGDSMEPDFPDGSIAFVNHDQMRDGDIGVFCVDGATVIKQWHYDPVLGITYLFSLNRKRNDCDLVIMNSSNRSLVWQGRVLTRRRYDLPGMV